MRFARIGDKGRETPVLVEGETFYDLSSLTADITGDFLADGADPVRTALEAGALPTFDAAGKRRGAPIARPSAIICIGMNYAAHAAESGSLPPEHMVVFMKTPNTLGGPDDDVAIPRRSEKTDWEVELGVVIGRRASYLADEAEAMAHVAGYVLANDLSERAWQLEVSGGQWGKGKSAAGFSPVGPWLVSADEVDVKNLRLRSWVNGEPRQDSSTADLIFGVAEIVHELSQYMVLEPGDLILTGTPEGVALSGRFPYLQPGDVVEVEIDGLGRQRQEMV
ncbi:2-keto-4-pentenoate hydratase/2-oxohepta-3-ene-1,7-dioic acid hydratase in catechol pathway [Microbacterium sp. AG1240]|uniref:fumarylacetoacetate hydrolase family protein n=1 Tax=Microbacterium sp. AG1240 TaxID=2183992 RepID=UPI000EABF25B|nr:fumarylacetoacetate hydrolase family protein [Microbacterium sp. AG1240]RKT31640.1 2-keto-4-pentenoate hydratase/2-oxohepta-3-ene-1,7-dioic acid hydratase in catechol pathway [Microbacterium sp. AG1240]